jgi:hypothetical protein
MREKGVKSILKSKKHGNNSCPRPRISIYPIIVDANAVSKRQPRSYVGIVERKRKDIQYLLDFSLSKVMEEQYLVQQCQNPHHIIVLAVRII